MAEAFEAITTQEEFDKRIKERLDRAENKWKEKFKGYMSPEEVANASKEKADEFDKLTKDLAAANETIKAHADEKTKLDAELKTLRSDALKTKVARDKGLDWGVVEFLHGDTEEAISESADKLKKLGFGGEPMRTREPATDDHESDRNLVRALLGKN